MNNTPTMPELAGFRLCSVEKRDFSWFFVFTGHVGITTDRHWRFVSEDHLVVTAEDHGEQFGLTCPVDAATCVLSALENQPIKFAHLDHATGDLFIYFSARTFLQFLQMSGGHEAWRLDKGDNLLICSGGGKITRFDGKHQPLPVLGSAKWNRVA